MKMMKILSFSSKTESVSPGKIFFPDREPESVSPEMKLETGKRNNLFFSSFQHLMMSRARAHDDDDDETGLGLGLSVSVSLENDNILFSSFHLARETDSVSRDISWKIKYNRVMKLVQWWHTYARYKSVKFSFTFYEWAEQHWKVSLLSGHFKDVIFHLTINILSLSIILDLTIS